MGKRHQARELALQVLFHMEFNPDDPEESFRIVCENFAPPRSIRPFSKELVFGVCRHREDLDRLIGKASRNWKLHRMSRVDRNILRVGVFELIHMEDIPPKVSIDEAVELGKRFGTGESGSFINGILDYVYNTIQGETRETEPIE
ncbi:MAG: transcription antitermination factor NusB [Deltaproteobacteria bacterium]|nr:transcription antitermination factor NusB [Deltaproteobacteria bacterium]